MYDAEDENHAKVINSLIGIMEDQQQEAKDRLRAAELLCIALEIFPDDDI